MALGGVGAGAIAGGAIVSVVVVVVCSAWEETAHNSPIANREKDKAEEIFGKDLFI
jgi:hypothetical protein